MQFLRGRVLDRLEQPHDALNAYVAAREEDVCPLRALRAIGQIVRDTGDERNVPVVDFEAIAGEHSPQRIPGRNLFIDHVHPTIDGNRLLAMSILESLIDAGIVEATQPLTETTVETIAGRINDRVNQADHGLALRNLSKVLGWAGKFEEADRLALQAVEMIPDDADARHLAGNACIRRSEPVRAIEFLQQALQLDPGRAASWYSLGVAFSEAGRLTDAVAAYQRALELDPQTQGVHHNLGVAYDGLGQIDLAISHYQEEINRRPERVETYNSLGLLHAARGQLDQARELFRQSLDINRRQPDALTNLGRVELFLGQAEAAIALFREALLLDRLHVAAASNLAWVLATSPEAARRSGTEAVQWAQMCVKQAGGNDPNLFSILAAAHAEAGDFPAAIQWQQKALDLLGDNPPADLLQRLEQYQAEQPYHVQR
jgi:tetratricopeptide (TPR) repeat protein